MQKIFLVQSTRIVFGFLNTEVMRKIVTSEKFMCKSLHPSIKLNNFLHFIKYKRSKLFVKYILQNR